MEPVRIFVGCSANAEDAEAQAMLEYSLRHYATQPLEITWMMLSHDPQSPWYSNANAGWNTKLWHTPFSVFRWSIPYACNYQGKAIYMDVDMIARDDIAKLWNQPFPSGKAILWKDDKYSCVMLMNCAAMKNALPPFENMRRKLGGYSVYRDNHARPIAARFAGNWNCLDGENYSSLADPDIKVLHFTYVPSQPHLKLAYERLKAQGKKHWNTQQLAPHRRPDMQPLVQNVYDRAVEAGYTPEKYEAIATNFGAYDGLRA